MSRLRRLLFTATVAASVTALAIAAVGAPVGASSGPTMLKNINQSGNSDPSYLTKVGSTLFFAANDGIHGRELWKSDGTAVGTKMVKDVRAGSRGSFPADLINVNGTLFFTANDGAHGRELWKSNGMATGTKMVKDLTNGEISGTNTNLYLPVAVGSRLFFFVTDCCAGGSSLVVSDGTAAGTNRIDKPLEEVSSARALGAKLFFVQTDYSVDPPGQALWVSNGTSTGTRRFAPAPSGDQISILPASGNFLYFTAADSGVGLRLWRTDGTASGTIALTALGQLSDVPTGAVYMNHAIYFLEESDSSAISGLWQTNGTPAGTGIIKIGYFYELVTSGGRLYFIDTGLWRSDGTTGGTKDLGEFGSVEPRNLTAVGSYVCFAETNFYVDWWHLWASSGTVSTTHQVGQWPNNAAMYTRAAVGSRLYFAANDGAHGNELWSYTP